MRTIGNILWLALAGVWLAIGNVLWFVLAGWWLAIAHVVTGMALVLTIIGIPLGVANFKLALLALVPFGKTVVPLDAIDGRDIYMRGPEPVR